MTVKTTAFLGQPKSFYLIFFVEMWERFGYYGVQALLVLYMVRRLGFSDAHADFLFAAFSALVWLFPCIGGYIGDRILGSKRTVLLGAITLAIGYLLLSFDATPHFFIWPLAVIAVGNGLFKANPSSLLSKAYEGTSCNLDSGFTLYYLAINIGSFLSMNVTPILHKFFGWHVAFSVCFFGLIIAIINFVIMRRHIAHIGSDPDWRPIKKDQLAYVLLFCLALIFVVSWLLVYYTIVFWLLIVCATGLLLYYFFLMFTAELPERKGMGLFIILFLQGIIFFVLYFQMPTSLTLFALRNVEPSILGIPIQPAQFQMLASFWIMTLSPVFAGVYYLLARWNRDPSLPTKFSLGTLLAGLAFLVLPLGGLFNHNGIISGLWLVLSYGLEGAAELLVSALGLSLAARYVPQRFMGFSMGLWFLCPSIASIVAGKVASIASVPQYTVSVDPLLSLPIYNHLFLEVGIATLILSGIMFAFVPALKKLAHGRTTATSSDLTGVSTAPVLTGPT